MIINILLVAIGFFLLIKGADVFVDAISETSINLKIPKIIISLTIVAFGTSAPELFISFQGLLNGNSDVVFANVVGSTIVNTMLVIGIVAIVKPIKIKNETIKKQLPLHFITILVFSILLLDSIFNHTINTISRSDGIILFLIFILFIYYIYKFNSKSTFFYKEKPRWNIKKAIVLSIVSLLAIAIGSNLAVDNCTIIAHKLNISEKLITMLILVIGTSTPEIIMGYTSAKKGEFDIILGNIIGTNIFNIGLALGLPVILYGNVSTYSFNIIDMFFMILSGGLLYLFAKDDRKIDQFEGITMISIFIIYYIYLFIS